MFARIWERIQSRCAELDGVDWEWESADAAMGKARLGGYHWPQPHRPRKAGHQAQHPGRGQRRAVSVVLAGANVHDTKLLGMSPEAIVIERPIPTEQEPQHLCLDKGYDNPTG